MRTGYTLRGNREVKEPIRISLIASGALCVALGVLGMFLPVLPTTPFLLIAAYCFARSSDRFYRWLMNNRLCGRYIRNYREGRGIPLKQKALTISLLWLTIVFSAAVAVSEWWARLVLLAIAAGVTVHIVKIRTCKPEAQPGPSLAECDASEEALREPAESGTNG